MSASKDQTFIPVATVSLPSALSWPALGTSIRRLHPAERMLRQCYHIYEAELGPNHEDSIEVIASLVDVLYQVCPPRAGLPASKASLRLRAQA